MEKKDSIVEHVFDIHRYSPEELFGETEGFWSSRKLPTRSYNITSDMQRFLFVQRVLNKELTIREVISTSSSLGRSTLQYHLLNGKDRDEDIQTGGQDREEEEETKEGLQAHAGGGCCKSSALR